MPRQHSSKATRGLRLIAAASSTLLLTSGTHPLNGQAPDGNVPFTQAQAAEGSRVYTEKCAACHGGRLDDGAAPPLAGPRFIQTWTAPGRTVDDLFFIIRTTMPKNEAGTLT